MVTKMLYDNLTNFAGYGVEDPRADHIIPWAYSHKSANSPAQIKWDGNWRRSLGVDMQSGIQAAGGPLRAIFGVDTAYAHSGNHWWVPSTSEARWGDTVYVEETSRSKGYHANKDLYFRAKSNDDNSRESGTFYTRVSAPTYVGTYAECCFIKAEVLFRQGNAAAAYTAYKEGVKASIELMNSKLRTWVSEDENLASCPSFAPMSQTDIDNFLNNGLGTASDLTLGKIMTQKRIALLFSMEVWNDMRRYDYDSNIFLGWAIPAQHALSAEALKAIPEGKQFRRWMQCSHERNYNADNLQAIGSEVPGANMSLKLWNAADDVWTIPVWWDSDQQ